MTTVVQMTDQQFDKLIETIRLLAPQLPKAQEEQEKISKGSFSKCKTKFGGQLDCDAVEEFIHAIETYKDVEEISDRDALKGIGLLFEGEALVWWKGVKRFAKTWPQALQMLREHFAPAQPPYEIYQEIFNEAQSSSEALDTFVCKKRALLAKLPEGLHDEETELNFIYGLLNIKYREKIPRLAVKTYRELLEKGRNLERIGKSK